MPQSEVIRAIVLEGSPWREVPHPQHTSNPMTITCLRKRGFGEPSSTSACHGLGMQQRHCWGRWAKEADDAEAAEAAEEAEEAEEDESKDDGQGQRGR